MNGGLRRKYVSVSSMCRTAAPPHVMLRRLEYNYCLAFSGSTVAASVVIVYAIITSGSNSSGSSNDCSYYGIGINT